MDNQRSHKCRVLDFIQNVSKNTVKFQNEFFLHIRSTQILYTVLRVILKLKFSTI